MVQQGLGRWLEEEWVSPYHLLVGSVAISSYEYSVDSIPAMKTALVRLRDKLGSDPEYFKLVYNYTFEFSRPAGQRSLGSISPPYGLRYA